jgi:YD repeat-containing protein
MWTSAERNPSPFRRPHDALGRVLTAISPDGSEVAYTYNQRGALKAMPSLGVSIQPVSK